MKGWYTTYGNILHLHFSDGYLNLPESAKAAVSPKSPLKRCLKIAGYTLLRLFGNLFKQVENPDKLNSKVWLYVVSQNNYDSLRFIKKDLPSAVFVAGQSKNVGKYKTSVERLSLRSKILFYYKFLPLLWKFWKEKPKSTARFYDVLYDAVGFYEVYLSKLKKYKPAAVVFANDHNPDARAMLLAANQLGIKTIYIQHASVSTLFPPLQFSLALLEGQDSLEKYKQCGPITGDVELIGMPKADEYVKSRNTSPVIKSIGIGCNLMDSTEEVVQVVKQLLISFPHIEIKFRPHPRDTRDFKALLPDMSLLSFSGKEESVFDFLTSIDALIAGNSGIHLEAVLLNVWSIYYNFNSKETLDDYYGFVKHGLVDSVNNYTELEELLRDNLNSKHDVYLRAKYFNAVVGTDNDGLSSKLAVKHINNFINFR